MTRPEPERTALVIDGARGIASDYLRRSDPHHFHTVADHIGSERSPRGLGIGVPAPAI